jgi:hypothetical protein
MAPAIAEGAGVDGALIGLVRVLMLDTVYGPGIGALDTVLGAGATR